MADGSRGAPVHLAWSALLFAEDDLEVLDVAVSAYRQRHRVTRHVRRPDPDDQLDPVSDLDVVDGDDDVTVLEPGALGRTPAR